MPKTLHIAICNTNFAERKQLERLLNKEKDTRKDHSLLYIETFGSASALLYTKRIYDVYFIDIQEENYSSSALSKELKKKGILSPIILFSIDKISTPPQLADSSLGYLHKPVNLQDLSLLLDNIILLKEEQHIPRIEFRNSKETYYEEPKNIVFIGHQGLTMYLHLSNGEIKEARGELENTFPEFSSYHMFFMPNKHYIINASYISKLSPFYMTLMQTSIPISIFNWYKIRQLLKQ